MKGFLPYSTFVFLTDDGTKLGQTVNIPIVPKIKFGSNERLWLVDHLGGYGLEEGQLTIVKNMARVVETDEFEVVEKTIHAFSADDEEIEFNVVERWDRYFDYEGNLQESEPMHRKVELEDIEIRSRSYSYESHKDGSVYIVLH